MHKEYSQGVDEVNIKVRDSNDNPIGLYKFRVDKVEQWEKLFFFFHDRGYPVKKAFKKLEQKKDYEIEDFW